jgi:translation elongation factor EF-1alpha
MEAAMAEEEEIGQVRDYFARIGVAGIDLTGRLKVGDTIQIKGHTTDLQQVVDSMQIEHDTVQEAGPGDSVGIKVQERCRSGDHVYRVTE